MTDQTAILTVAILAAIFVSLWVFNAKQKRKFEDQQRRRRLQRERAKLKSTHPESNTD